MNSTITRAPGVVSNVRLSRPWVSRLVVGNLALIIVAEATIIASYAFNVPLAPSLEAVCIALAAYNVASLMRVVIVEGQKADAAKGGSK